MVSFVHCFMMIMDSTSNQENDCYSIVIAILMEVTIQAGFFTIEEACKTEIPYFLLAVDMIIN